MKGRERRGFTLIELVAGTGALLLLVALQLPAIDKAREAARRARSARTTSSRSPWRPAITSAVAADTFPMSNVVGPGRDYGHGCFTQILPYLEQVAAYNAYNFWLENWHEANSTAVGLKIATFLCPANRETDALAAADISTHNGKPYPGKSLFGAGHYGANWGGVRKASGAGLVAMYPDPKSPASHLGVILTVVDPEAKEKTRNISLLDVTDGTSATIAYGEKRDSFGWAVGGWGGTEFDVNASISYEGGNAVLNKVFTGSSHPEGLNIVRLWLDGAPSGSSSRPSTAGSGTA